MKLEKAKGWCARLRATIPLKKELVENPFIFPFDVGCVTLDNEQGDYIWLETYETNWTLGGNNFAFNCKLNVFSDEMEMEKEVFDFEVENLENCTAEFYCSSDDEYREFFDMDNAVIECVVFMEGLDKEPTHIIKCVLEPE